MTLANIPQDIRNEFTVDAEGKVFAKSVTAVGRLAGVSKNALLNTNERGLLWKIRGSQNLPKSLERFTGQDFTSGVNLPDVLVSGIVEYYAFDSDAANETAKTNYRAMATVGFRTWFQQALGWKEPKPSVMSHVEALRAYADVLEEKERIEAKHPGLKTLTGTTEPLEGLQEPYTVREWLDYKGYPATSQQCKNFGKMVANSKRCVMQVKYHSDTFIKTEKLYYYTDLDLLDTSWNSFQEDE